MEKIVVDEAGEIIKEPVEGMVGYDEDDRTLYFVQGRWMLSTVVYPLN